VVAAVHAMRAAAGARIPPGAGALLAALALLQALEAAHEDEAPVTHLHDAFVAGRDVGVAGLGRFVRGASSLFRLRDKGGMKAYPLTWAAAVAIPMRPRQRVMWDESFILISSELRGDARCCVGSAGDVRETENRNILPTGRLSPILYPETTPE